MRAARRPSGGDFAIGKQALKCPRGSKQWNNEAVSGRCTALGGKIRRRGTDGALVVETHTILHQMGPLMRAVVTPLNASLLLKL